MGQTEVYNFLKKNKGKWHTSEQIARGIKLSRNSVSTSLRRLREAKQVYFIEDKRRKKTYQYMVK